MPAEKPAEPPDAQPWTIIRLLDWTRQFFATKGIDDPRLEAELLLSHALALPRIQLYMKHDVVVAEPALGKFRDLVRRRGHHVPTQYLLGEAQFRDLRLKVTPAVLIPRPETEILVDEVLIFLRSEKRPPWEFDHGQFTNHRGEPEASAAKGAAGTDADAGAASETPDGSGGVNLPAEGQSAPSVAQVAAEQTAAFRKGLAAKKQVAAARQNALRCSCGGRVLDLCTGSGCVAIAVATECAGATVVATDLSPEALAVARENAAANGVADVADRVQFLAGDLYAALEALPPAERAFDVIATNPPYISETEFAAVMPEVRDHEPGLALVPGPTGLEIIARILAAAPEHLRPEGRLFMEIGYRQAAQVRELAAGAAGLELLRIRRDLGGHERIVEVRRR